MIVDKEYIERGALICKTHELFVQPNIDLWQVMNLVQNIPAADVREVRHGEWVTQEYQYGEHGESDKWVEKPAEYGDCAYCSLCLANAGLNGAEEYVLSNYCPNCGADMKGAKMDGKVENDE